MYKSSYRQRWPANARTHHARTHAHARPPTHTHTHTYIHTHTSTYIHTYLTLSNWKNECHSPHGHILFYHSEFPIYPRSGWSSSMPVFPVHRSADCPGPPQRYTSLLWLRLDLDLSFSNLQVIKHVHVKQIRDLHTYNEILNNKLCTTLSCKAVTFPWRSFKHYHVVIRTCTG